MNIIIKKIIAREILIFISTIFFGLLGSLFIYLFSEHQIKLQTEIETKNEISKNKISNYTRRVDELKYSKDTLYSLYENLKSLNYDVPNTYSSFRKTLINDTQNRISYYNYLKKANYKYVSSNFNDFNKTFFPNNSSAANSSDTFQLNKLKKEISELESSINPGIHPSPYKTNKLLFIFCLITFIIVYPLRLFVAILKWSIKTLKK